MINVPGVQTNSTPLLRMNGASTQQSQIQLANALANARSKALTSGLEDDWDEDVVIGGKKLAGFLEDEVAKAEVERLGKILEDLD